MQNLHLLGSGPSGAYANTYFYKNSYGKKFVVKEPHYEANNFNEITHDQVREIAILRYLPKHPNIVNFMGYLDNKIVTAYAGRTLAKYLPRKKYKSLVYQLIEGVSFLHLNKIAHRDLSNKNIVIKGGRLVIIDFGMARYMATEIPGESTYTSHVTSLWHRAPELLSAEKSTLNYDARKIDDWSVGILITEIMGGISWLRGSRSKDQKLIFTNINVDNIISYLKQFYLSRWFEEVEYLLRGFLNKDPLLRLGCINANQYLKLNIGVESKPINLYPLKHRTVELKQIRMKQINMLVKFIKKINCNTRLLSISCSIMDAYQSMVYDSEWEIVAYASLSLASKIIENEVLKSINISKKKYLERNISEKQTKIINILDCQLIYEIMEDYLSTEYTDIEQKKIILINDYNISAKQMALKLKTLIKINYYNS